jgi:hypothetical protein
MAVWLCELRLWLSIIIDSAEVDPCAVPPLPNLDHNILPGDSLSGGGINDAPTLAGDARDSEELRARYMRATGHRKYTLRKQLDKLQRNRAIALCTAQLLNTSEKRRDLLASERSLDLFGSKSHRAHARPAALVALSEKSRRLRDARRKLERGGALPFSYRTHFPEACSAGGFDVVLGNPPWVRLERIPEDSRASMRREYDVFRLDRWQPAGGANTIPSVTITIPASWSVVGVSCSNGIATSSENAGTRAANTAPRAAPRIATARV